jgi:hypothetical protein
MTETTYPPALRTHDNTMFDAYNYCQRLYAISHVRNKRPRATRSALSFGGFIHTGLDWYYKGLVEYDRDWKRAAERMLDTVNEVDYTDPDGDFRTKARGMRDLVKYAQHWQHDPDLTNILFTETAFDIVAAIKGVWPYGGVIDVWPEYHGNTYIMDHKTTTRFGNYFFDNFRRAPQMMGYIKAGDALQGVMPAGALINVMILHKGETGFDRQPLLYPEWLMREWEHIVDKNYNEIRYKLAQTEAPEDIWNIDIWKPNFYQCIGKYGRCSAYEVCHANPLNRERILDFEFEDHRWDWAERDD